MHTITSAAAAVTAATAAALLLGGPAAAAEPVPSVVGMSESTARATLTEEGVPYTVLNRSGSASASCTVTEQRDRGYRTETDMVYDHDDHEFDRVETQVWRGIGLVVLCN
ncbi:PASTA domain-containing protein [Rhodococcus zopfii]|uniref:PASTA domain-containing protein n=1 Tax=Rhodococcus zopfii TaxID=43772 RepID=UPI000933F98F|nr:PASTA domain-containing protein [Rhodococcus zopfii]